MVRALRPLSIPAFWRLGLGRLVDELGNWLGEIALAVLVFDRTGSALATTALFLGLQFAPALSTAPLVARLESLPSRAVLPALNLLQAAVYAALAALAGSRFHLGPVVALAIIGGILAICGRTLTRAAAAAALLPAGLLREGNALLNVAFTAGAAAGPAFAGLVIAGAGVRTALLADAGSFVAVALLLATASRLPRPRPDRARWRTRVRLALDYVRTRPQLRRLLVAQAAAFVFFAVVIPIEVVFAKRTLGAGDAGYGALLASWGVGMVAGSFAFAALRRVRLRALLGVSTLAVGCAYLATGAAPSLVVACVASALGGAGNGIQWVAVMTAVQQLARADYQARVIALLESLASAMPGVGFVIGGGIAALVSPRASYAVAGAGVLVVLVVAAIALERSGWRGEEIGDATAAPDFPAQGAEAARVPGGATVDS